MPAKGQFKKYSGNNRIEYVVKALSTSENTSENNILWTVKSLI